MAARTNANSERPRFRPIQPALSSVAEDVEGASSQPRIARVELKKPCAVGTACNSCRRQKIKCSGGRPRCAGCIRRQVVCEYERGPNETATKAAKRKCKELQCQNTPHERILDALRSRPDVDVEAILRKLRRGESLEDIAREIECGDVLIQIAVAPETNYRYVFPVSSTMPQYLLSQLNPYLNSLIYEWSKPSPAHEASGGMALQKECTVGPGFDPDVYAPYLKPYHAAEMMDSRLDAVLPSKWTEVCSDNGLMRRLLRAFFCQVHDWWTVLHKDYFLEDMAEMRCRFCSSLLVNTVLSVSCNCYRGLTDRTEFRNPKTLGYRFLAEARRLWEYEMHKSKLTTAQAGLLLQLVYSGAGADAIGYAFTIQACAIAHNMGLFQQQMVVEDDRLRDARNYTAWTLYSWQSLICFHYFRSPLLKEAPVCVLRSPEDNVEWYGEVWLRFPLSNPLHPSHSGAVFKAKAEFAVILNELGQRLFGDTEPSPTLSAVEIFSFYKKFQSWYNNLPESLSPRKVVLPSHLKLHMHYFIIVLRLLRSPSINEDGAEGHAIAIGMLSQAPHEILTDARASLETLLRVYYLRHGFELLDSFIIAPLMEVSQLAMDAISVPTSQDDTVALHSTIVLVAKGIYEQGQNIFLGKLVFHAMKAKMDPKTLSMLKQIIKTEPLGEKAVAELEHLQVQWPVNVTSVADNSEEKRLYRMIEDLDVSN